MRNELNDVEIQEVKKQAREKLGIYRKTNGIIGTQIFSILKLGARVIYYPFGKNAPWGFTRIRGASYYTNVKKPFVAINTSISIPCQVFAAAHELYHIWYEQGVDILPNNLLNEGDRNLNERKANRFAAEFLMDELMLRQEIETYKIKSITIKEGLQLAELFMVPYRAMIKRLWETSYIKDREKEELLSESDDAIERYRKKYALNANAADNKIAMDNLAELSINAYDSKLVTYEKLEYLLKLCGLKPKDFGIEQPSNNSFPHERELDEIMEEDE